MKKFCITLTLMVFLAAALCSTAMAAAFGNQAFTTYSAASAAVKTSAALSVRGFKTKTLTVSGVTIGSSLSSITYKNMSGTAIVEEAPTATGPWSTAVANDYAQTAVSRTTNGTMTWSDAAAYIRIKWTAGTVGTKLKAWLNWSE